DWIGEDLGFPSQTVIESKVRTNLPLVLDEQRVVFILDLGRACCVGRGTASAGSLQIEQKMRGICAWAEARTGGRISKEAGHAVKDVAAGEEPSKHLVVQRVYPLAAHPPGMPSCDDREVVLEMGAPDQLIDVGIEEERIAKPECGHKSHRGVRGQVGRRRGAWTRFARVTEVSLVQLRWRERRVEVHVVNFGRALGSVRRRSVGGDIKGLVLVLRVVEVVGQCQLI